MGCKKHGCDTGSCVCDALANIKKAQDKVERRDDGCSNSCYSDLLSPRGRDNRRDARDTVPFLLQGKDGKYFYATGGIGTRDCFQTVFFRVESIDEDKCCATLSLLEPDMDIEFDKCCVDPTSLCDVDEVERTRECIEVDLNCFCAVQCLDPDLVGDIDKKRHHHHHHGK
ncbi:CotY/CotZ family spore coat protein [Alteribacillus iranensis]|uniref:Spore coat protein Y/spore coat protein Z n=1 Tax=Alteribacillus iranensis TaxID=930128 RepID=A0A1I2D1W3_9BACI|nr:CotY/CotZ family spore coat protein [Alteribacillus iranensis]SFE74512.1 spore coat protein Y/spore coat protein Z [Alteribacillus iranensis]